MSAGDISPSLAVAHCSSKEQHCATNMDSSKVHVALLASPGMGHLIPVMVLANRLITHHDVHVTLLVVTTNTSATETQILRRFVPISNHFEIVKIPPPDISGLVDHTTKVVTQLAVVMRAALPSIRAAISDLPRRPDVLIADLFGTESWSVADEFKMRKYVYVTSTAWFVALTTYCHVLDKEVVGQYVDQKESLRIPGVKPVRPEDVVEPMLDRNDQQYREYVRQGIEYSLADGIMMNTWQELEPASIKALRENEILHGVVKVPVYPVGPLRTATDPSGSTNSELTRWLDEQPAESVLYVSFGSGGTLSVEQITEVAWGLELSEQRFVWVLRPPTEDRADGSFFTAGSRQDGTPDYLPDGFLRRVKNRCYVVPHWAPQVEVLKHPSVGGFLSHCGWNSAQESIMSGVPIIAWPLYAEQRLNATMLTEELGVAVRPKVLPTKKVVGREELEKLVRTLMEYREGKLMREKVKELRGSGERALSKGGSSYNSMCELIKECQSVCLTKKNMG